MLYETKQGSKAYEYIKSILDAEEKERQAYMKRVEEAVGFEFEKYQGYQPNRTITREYEITAIWVLSERYDTLDKKVWKKIDDVKLEDGYYDSPDGIVVFKYGAFCLLAKNGRDFCVALTYLMSEKDSLNRFKVIGNKFDKKK